jgi:hypothetical protein
VVYRNKSAAVAGIRELRLRPGAGTAGVFVVKGRGAALGMPPLPVTLPVTAQLANLDGGACWESAFASAKRNGTAKVSLP